MQTREEDTIETPQNSGVSVLLLEVRLNLLDPLILCFWSYRRGAQCRSDELLFYRIFHITCAHDVNVVGKYLLCESKNVQCSLFPYNSLTPSCCWQRRVQIQTCLAVLWLWQPRFHDIMAFCLSLRRRILTSHVTDQVALSQQLNSVHHLVRLSWNDPLISMQFN